MVCEWTAAGFSPALASALLESVLDFVVVVVVVVLLLTVVLDDGMVEEEEEEEVDVDVWKAVEEENADAESGPCPLLLLLSCPLDEPWTVGRFLCFMVDGCLLVLG